MSRKSIPLKIQLAAAILQWARETLAEHSSDKLYHDAKQMTADQIISLFQLHHHPIPHAAGGPDEPWNLQWEWRSMHRWLTRKETTPQLAKAKRLTKAQEDMRRILTKPCGHRRKRSRRWPSRPLGRSRKPRRSRR